MEYTPGPWYTARTDNIHDQGLVISEATGANIAVTYQGRADALLCAAAPDLLAALRALCDTLAQLDPGWDADDEVRAARAAIAKAEGRA